MKNVMKFAALAGVAALALTPELAHAAAATTANTGTAVAASDLTQTLNNLQSETSSVPNIIGWFCYIVGVAFVAFGVFKLKQHADNAAQNKLGPALGLLLVGAAFLALPGIAGAVVNTNKFGVNTTFSETFK